MYIKCGVMERKKTMAMFEVKGSRHAEGQQTEHDLLGGIGKHLTGDTTWGWRWITPGIAQTLFQKDNRIGSQHAIYLHLRNSLVWHFCNCRMFPSSCRMDVPDKMYLKALWTATYWLWIKTRQRVDCEHSRWRRCIFASLFSVLSYPVWKGEGTTEFSSKIKLRVCFILLAVAFMMSVWGAKRLYRQRHSEESRKERHAELSFEWHPNLQPWHY